MVPPENGYPIFVSHFQGEKQSDSLDRVMTSINIVTHKQIVRFRHLTTNLEELHQVMELTVNVPTNDHRCTHGHNIGFLSKYFLGLFAESLHLSLRKRFACKNLGYLFVQI